MALAVHPGRDFIRWLVIGFGAATFWSAVGACVPPALAVERGAPAAATAARVTVIDSLVVTASVTPDPFGPAPSGLVTRLELRDGDAGRDAANLLGRMAGLQMARTGGWGNTAVPSLRGSAPAQIRFFLDGMPLPDAQTGLAGFQLVPLSRITAIEVHRGVVPVGLGGIGGAGAVDFLTRTRDDGVDATARMGAWGGRGLQASAGAAGADGNRSGLLLVHGLRVDNDFTYLDHNQTFHRDDDDTVRVRDNAQVREWGVWSQGRISGDVVELKGSAGFVRRDGGRPGPIGYPSPHASVLYDRLDARLRAALQSAPLVLEAAAGRGHEVLDDPRGEIGFAPPGESRSVGEDLTLRLTWSPQLRPGWLGLQAGGAWRGQWQDDTFPGKLDPQRSRRETTLFAALDATAAGGRLHLSPAVRWQHTRDDFPTTPGADETRRNDASPAVGVVWSVRPDRVFLSAHAAYTVRPPSWVELFGHRGGIDGNPKLLPEDIASADVAVNLRHRGRYSLRLALYFAETDDKIVFVQNSQRTSKAINLGRARVRGLEFEGALGLPADLEISANLTLQEAEDTSPVPVYHGKSLPFLPAREGQVRLERTRGPWRPRVDVAFMSANYRDRANTELDKAPARTVVDAGLGRTWRGPSTELSIQAEIFNITDNTVYDVEGFPLPGRSWRLSARIRR